MTTLRFTWWWLRKVWRVYREVADIWMAASPPLRHRDGAAMQSYARMRLEQELGIKFK